MEAVRMSLDGERAHAVVREAEHAGVACWEVRCPQSGLWEPLPCVLTLAGVARKLHMEVMGG